MQDLAALNRSTQLSTSSNDFVRYTKCLMASRFKYAEAVSIAKDIGVSPRVQEILKTAVDVGTTVDQDWAAPLAPYKQIAEGFAASLAPFSAFDRIMSDNAWYRVPFKTQISVASSAATGSNIISELAAKPISQLGFTRAVFEPFKVAAFVVLSDELLRSALPASVTMLGNELRRACALATDQVLLDVLTSATSVASNGSTGSTAAAFIHDLEVAARAISLGANSKPYLILPPDTCKAAALLRDTAGNLVFPQMTVTGGVIQGIKCVVSDAATTDAVLVDASQVAVADDPIVLSEGHYASVEMSDSPTSGATEMVSLWQSGLVGLKAERQFGCEVLRSTTVAVITSVTA